MIYSFEIQWTLELISCSVAYVQFIFGECRIRCTPNCSKSTYLDNHANIFKLCMNFVKIITHIQSKFHLIPLFIN
jgi:hypothetical protein